jgi:hypothetical protein
MRWWSCCTRSVARLVGWPAYWCGPLTKELVLGHAPIRPTLQNAYAHRHASRTPYKNDARNHKARSYRAEIHEAISLHIYRAIVKISSVALLFEVVLSTILDDVSHHVRYPIIHLFITS